MKKSGWYFLIAMSIGQLAIMRPVFALDPLTLIIGMIQSRIVDSAIETYVPPMDFNSAQAQKPPVNREKQYSSAPLESWEIDEIVRGLTSLNKIVSPGQPLDQAKIWELLRFQTDLAPVMRQVADELKLIESRRQDAKALYGKMSPTERDLLIRKMRADYEKLEGERKEIYAAAVQADLFGLPAELKTSFR